MLDLNEAAVDPSRVEALVFDLDGTLYTSRPFGEAIAAAAAGLVAIRRGITVAVAVEAIRGARREVAAETGRESTLTEACRRLGIDVVELHAHFAETLKPEEFLAPDPKVAAFLEELARNRALHLYTNNSRRLSVRILRLLGLEEFFTTIFTIEDARWRPKPNRDVLEELLARIAVPAQATLFVGDRSDIDLAVPAEAGAQVFHVRTVADLSVLHDLFSGGNA